MAAVNSQNHRNLIINCHSELKADKFRMTEKSILLQKGNANFRCLNLPFSSESIDMTNYFN